MSNFQRTEVVVYAARSDRVIVDPSYVTFVAKAQRVKTRKDKDYFVLRITIPKDAAEQVGMNPNDYLVLKAKKAKWYHLIDWNSMEHAWSILPPNVKDDIRATGLPNPANQTPQTQPISALNPPLLSSSTGILGAIEMRPNST